MNINNNNNKNINNNNISFSIKIYSNNLIIFPFAYGAFLIKIFIFTLCTN